jgi:hypothetical protein
MVVVGKQASLKQVDFQYTIKAGAKTGSGKGEIAAHG